MRFNFFYAGLLVLAGCTTQTQPPQSIHQVQDKYQKDKAKVNLSTVKLGLDVLLDDRDDRAGVKFKDAELIGIPFQIIIGRDSINKEVELLCRTNNTKLKISTDKLLETFISESEIMYNKKS